jgi:hypothetical protein
MDFRQRERSLEIPSSAAVLENLLFFRVQSIVRYGSRPSAIAAGHINE